MRTLILPVLAVLALAALPAPEADAIGCLKGGGLFSGRFRLLHRIHDRIHHQASTGQAGYASWARTGSS